MPRSANLYQDQDLQKGSVDDRGDAKYLRLEQNVPDGFVYDLQTDLYAMGFTILGRSGRRIRRKNRESGQTIPKTIESSSKRNR